MEFSAAVSCVHRLAALLVRMEIKSMNGKRLQAKT